MVIPNPYCSEGYGTGFVCVFSLLLWLQFVMSGVKLWLFLQLSLLSFYSQWLSAVHHIFHDCWCPSSFSPEWRLFSVTLCVLIHGVTWKMLLNHVLTCECHQCSASSILIGKIACSKIGSKEELSEIEDQLPIKEMSVSGLAHNQRSRRGFSDHGSYFLHPSNSLSWAAPSPSFPLFPFFSSSLSFPLLSLPPSLLPLSLFPSLPFFSFDHGLGLGMSLQWRLLLLSTASPS